MADIVRLRARPVRKVCEGIVNIAVFLDLSEAVILTPNVVELLKETERCNFLSIGVCNTKGKSLRGQVVDTWDTPHVAVVSEVIGTLGNRVENVVLVDRGRRLADEGENELTSTSCNGKGGDHPGSLDIETPELPQNERMANTDRLAAEQRNFPSLPALESGETGQG